MSEQTPGVALVSGANRGIGREVARQLAERGYRVVLSARDGEKAAQVAAELRESRGGHVTPLTLDVADPASIARAAEQVSGDPGRVDVLVNNAGMGSDFGVAGVEPDFERIQEALDTNFFGSYRLTIALLGLLRKSEHGRIVNSACPGFVATDMGAPMGAKKSVEDGAAGIVWLATLPDGGPTGGFFRDGKAIAF